MARFIETPLSASTVAFQYMSGSTVTTLNLSAGNFTGGGGSGTTYSAGTGLSLNGTTFNHLNSIASASIGPTSATINSNVFAVPRLSYDSTGHITSAGTTTVTVPTGNASNVAVFNISIDSSNHVELLDGADMLSIYNAKNDGKVVALCGNHIRAAYNQNPTFAVTNCWSAPMGYILYAKCTYSMSTSSNIVYETIGFISGTYGSTAVNIGAVTFGQNSFGVTT